MPNENLSVAETKQRAAYVQSLEAARRKKGQVLVDGKSLINFQKEQTKQLPWELATAMIPELREAQNPSSSVSRSIRSGRCWFLFRVLTLPWIGMGHFRCLRGHDSSLPPTFGCLFSYSDGQDFREGIKNMKLLRPMATNIGGTTSTLFFGHFGVRRCMIY